MRMLATLQEPDQGGIRLGDLDVLNQKDEVRKTLGYLAQHAAWNGQPAEAQGRDGLYDPESR